MKLKLDADGHVVVQDGKPVYVADDGKEIAFDAVATQQTISRLNSEAKTHREGKEAAEKALKAFEGIADPAAAIKALETMSNLDQKKLIDAGEAQKVRDEIAKSYEAKLAEKDGQIAKLDGSLRAEMIGGSFARSKFVGEKSAIPADLIQARFGQNFKLEDGKVVAYDQSGNRIFSRARPGEAADFDEALEVLVDAYPYKDQILKSPAGGGGGTRQTTGATGGKVMTTTDFNKLSARDRSAAMAAGTTLTD